MPKDPVELLLLSLHYAPEPLGNAPYATSLTRGIAADGLRVRAIVGFPHYPQWRRYERGGLSRREDYDGVELTRLAHWIPRPPRGLRRLLSEFTFGLHQVTRAWPRNQVTVLLSPALFSTAMCIARLRLTRSAPTIVWVQDLYSQGMVETAEGSGAAARVVRHIESWTLRQADMVVAIHPSMAGRIATDLLVPPDKIRTIPNWSHIGQVPEERDRARARLGWSVDWRVVLHSGNMGRKQGLTTVVEAARIAHERGEDVIFVLLGDGAERAELESLAEGVPTLRFIDPLPDDLFSDALAAADILLVNELRGVKEMAAPSKLTSYFAANRPVLAAVDPEGIVAGILAEAGGGRVTGSGDARALLDGALDYLDHPEEMAAAAAAGSAYWHSHLSEDAAITAWREVLATVTGRKYQPTTL